MPILIVKYVLKSMYKKKDNYVLKLKSLLTIYIKWVASQV